MDSQRTASISALESARFFQRRLTEIGYDFFAGVPCSLLQAVYTVLEETAVPYYPATREDLALGLAAGAALAGRRPVVLMQNSGLGVCINALLTLQCMYQLRVLLVITWRGYVSDAPEHMETGAQMLSLLQALGIPHRLVMDVDAFSHDFHQHHGPVALLIRPMDFK